MPKVIALRCHTGALANYLSERGYAVIDYDTAYRPGIKTDAVLYTGYHPDMNCPHSSFTETADITLGNIRHPSDHVCPVMLNITGMSPEQVVQTLEQRLSRHSHIHS